MRREGVGESRRNRDCGAIRGRRFRGNVPLRRAITKSHGHIRLQHQFFRRSLSGNVCGRQEYRNSFGNMYV